MPRYTRAKVAPSAAKLRIALSFLARTLLASGIVYVVALQLPAQNFFELLAFGVPQAV
jgi:hypothetical protein